jgi:hypothetical protein
MQKLKLVDDFPRKEASISKRERKSKRVIVMQRERHSLKIFTRIFSPLTLAKLS